MVDSLNNSAKLAIDSQSLAQLRNQAKNTPDQALKSAAQQFESVFLNMMLKSMREATPQDGMFSNEQTKMFTGMLDQQLVQSMSNSGGVGLADVMVRQLSRSMGLPQPDAVVGNLPPPMPSLQKVAPAASQGVDSIQKVTLPSAFSGTTQQGFVDQMLPHALAASKETGVPPQLMLGQAALESGWGKREIRNADGSNSYNLFGIKAGSSWNGKVAEVTTTEYRNGLAYKQVEKFRAYGSYAEAFQDYARMMGNNPRYAAVMQQNDVQGMAQAVQDAGYATDPRYADKLARVMGMMNISA